MTLLNRQRSVSISSGQRFSIPLYNQGPTGVAWCEPRSNTDIVLKAIPRRTIIVNADEAKKSLQKQLNGGASSLVLLALLNQKGKPMYGYEIARELERRNGGSLPMTPGALYPVLRSLEKQELLSSCTELSDAGRARKYYVVTKTGSKAIEHWKTAWSDTKQFIDTILENGNDAANRKRDRKVSKTPRKSTRSGTAKR